MHQTFFSSSPMTARFCLLIAALFSATSTEAQQTFTVDRLTDAGEGDGLLGDLRYCITNATDGDSITFAVTGTINLTHALPDLTRSISIKGPGAKLLAVQRSTGSLYRVFTVIGATAFISGLTIANGHLDYNNEGAGIYNRGTLTISDSSIANNVVNDQNGFLTTGGGIFNSGTLFVINSTISGNQAANLYVFFGDWAKGGGIANFGRLTMINSTVSGNYAVGGSGEKCFSCDGLGGGIYNAGTLMIHNSTISGNRVDEPYAQGGGIYNAPGGVLDMHNTILFGNSARYGNGPDLSGELVASGYNVIGDIRGGSGFDKTDLLNVNPMLGRLQDNGGPTFTHALLPGSPAIDAGDPDFIGPPDFDQRGKGFPRIVNGIVDIGAFEVQADLGVNRK